MAKLQRVVGTTSQIVEVFIQDSSITTGGGKTGLVFNTVSLKAYYKRNTAATSTAITLVTATIGTFTSSGFVEVDAANMPGVYELHIPNAALVAGADSVVIMLQGATNMAPVLLEVELTAVNNLDATRFGLSALPNGAMAVKKNQALNAFMFPMFDSAGSPRTSLSVTAERAIDGGSFTACANNVNEIANGWYKIDLVAADLNGTVIALRFFATGVLDTDFTLVTQQ